MYRLSAISVSTLSTFDNYTYNNKKEKNFTTHTSITTLLHCNCIRFSLASLEVHYNYYYYYCCYMVCRLRKYAYTPTTLEYGTLYVESVCAVCRDVCKY